MTQWIAKKDDVLAKWGRGKRFNPPFNPKAVKPKSAHKKCKQKCKQVTLAALKVNDFIRARNWLEECQLGFIPRPIPDCRTPFKDGWCFGAKLLAKGYTKLGNGCFSTVYAKKDSPKVIKVTTLLDPWIDYCVWAAEKGYAGSFAPKVFSYKKFKGTSGDEFAVSIVERMEKGFYNVEVTEDQYLIQSLMWPAVRGNKMAQLYLDDLSPGLPKFLLDFHEKFGKDHTDIGGNNMMLRRDGTFCLTDPLAGTPMTDYKRLRSRDFTSRLPAIKGFLFESCFRY